MKKIIMKIKKTLPQCPNCKERYKLFKVNEIDEDGTTYPLLIEHSNTLCPYGLESYQKDINDCIKSVNEHILERFPWKKELYNKNIKEIESINLQIKNLQKRKKEIKMDIV